MTARRVGLAALAAWSISGCIDGSRVESGLPADYLGPPPEVQTGDADAGDAGDVPDADVPSPDADVPPPDVLDGGPDACVPGELGCASCATDAHCAQAFDDDDLCDGRWVCDGGVCAEDPTPVVCEGDADACRVSTCNPTTGACVGTLSPNGTACDDGQPCTRQDHCEAGECVSGPRLFCDDGNPCTDDTCDGDACLYVPQTGSFCDDGNPCTPNDSCSAGVCTSGASLCSCATAADCAPYDDGDLCNGTLVCAAGKCQASQAAVVICESEGCTARSCNPATGACEDAAAPDGAGCDDGDPCTVADSCAAGSCAGHALGCGDEPCRTGSCAAETGVCSFAPSGAAGCECAEDADCAALDDADLCNGVLACVDGLCRPDQIPDCGDPGNPCLLVGCDPATGACETTEQSGACDDGDPCTEGDTCGAGSCTGTVVSCAAEGTCTFAFCHPFSGCKVVPRGVTCNDGSACTTEACAGKQCLPISQKACPDPGACLAAACNTTTGACDVTNAAEACDDGDPCTHGDACVQGACVGIPTFCDDGNPCTSDSCVAGQGCAFAPNTLLCNDGNGCTTGDVCQDGTCAGGGLCECTTNADCFKFEDGDPCNGTLTCKSGQCAVDPATVVSCDPAGNTACLRNTCDPTTKACAMVPTGEGASCSDGDSCTFGDVCKAGACAGTPLDCDDGSPCTADACDGAFGCVHTPLDGAACDDGLACSTGTVCQGGQCAGGDVSGCPTCTKDSECAAQDDGNQCNGISKCMNGVCRTAPATIVVCEPSGHPCQDNVCDPASGVCKLQPSSAGAPCEDGSACTGQGTCQAGKCVGPSVSPCDGDNPCTVETCDPKTGTCAVQPVQNVCDDLNPCTTADVCNAGVCAGQINTCPCTLNADCLSLPLDRCLGEFFCKNNGCHLQPGTAVTCGGPGDTPCAFEGCDPETGSCVPVTLPAGVECDDGNACTEGEVCLTGGACGGDAVSCDDGDSCTTDACTPAGGCTHTPLPDGGACDDGDPCTASTTCKAGACQGGLKTCGCAAAKDCPAGGDKCNGAYSCVAGKCVLGAPVVCDDGPGACRPNLCDPATGQCAVVNAADGAPCVDGNLCTFDDFCLGGLCTGKKVACDDGETCTKDTCQAGLCKTSPLSDIPCNDGDFCTKLEKCQAGVCGGGVYVCQCNEDDDCLVFDDGNLCNGSYVCVDGGCQQKPAEPIACLDDDVFDCVDVACDPKTGDCAGTQRPDGTACDDGSVCTVIDTCVQGACVGVPVVTCEDQDGTDCIDHACDPILGACVIALRDDGAACDDGEACTENDCCAAGGCEGTLKECPSSGDECTLNVCSSSQGGCIAVKQFGPCDDGDACTAGEVCTNGECKGGTPLCDCSGAADCQALSSGDACGMTWKCGNFKCIPDKLPVSCAPDPAQPCMVPSCNPTTGACGLVPGNDGGLCDDGDPCTTGDRCGAGQCAGTPRDCDDGDSCTLDECRPDDGACLHYVLPTGFECDDGNPCNGADVCVGGSCKSGVEALCPCASDAACAAFDDADLCNGVLECGPGGQCRVDPFSRVACPEDASGCSSSACDIDSGLCVVTLAPTGTACSDGEPCTLGDGCDAGGACAGAEINCDDGDPCTMDSCDALLGCEHRAFSGPCDDAEPCTGGDVCVDGDCVGTPVVCDDGNICTADSCVLKTGCKYTQKAVAPACDDGNPCSINDKCVGTQCLGGGDVCGACVDASDCPPIDACLGQLTCQEGKCVVIPGSKPVCPAPTACTDVGCNPDGSCAITPKNEGGACDDGNACTLDDACAADGSCVGAPLNAGPCDDGDVCTVGDECVDGVCVTAPAPCTTDEPCKEAICLSGVGCQVVDSVAPCDDGDPCTIADRCAGGVCRGGESVPFLESFDDGEADGWALTSTGSVAGWQVSSFMALDGPFALWAGNALTGTGSDPTGAWTASAKTAAFVIPAGTEVAELRLWLWLAVDGAACTAGKFSVRANGAQVHQECASTKGWKSIPVNLLGFAGQSVQVELIFESGTSTAGAGAIVDDLRFDWQCVPEGP